MRRRLLNVLTALSLLLCVAVVALWVRSYRLADSVEWRDSRGWRSVRSARGYVVVGLLVADWSGSREHFHAPRYQRDGASPPYNWLLEMNGSPGDTLADWGRWGFEWHERRNAGRGTLNAVAVVPFWSLALATAAPPAAWALARWRSRARYRRGLCAVCGYDVRATPDRCPECGTIVAALPAA